MTAWWDPYIGTPYRDLNCWALVRRVYADVLRVDLPDHSDVSPDNLRAVAERMRDGQIGWVDGDGSPFDVVLMRRHRLPIHVGIVTKPGWVLHTEKMTDAVHVSQLHRSVAGRIVGFRRLP